MILFPGSWSTAVFALLSLAAALAYGTCASWRARAQTLLWLAYVFHTSAWATSFCLSPIRFGFASALSITTWLIVSVYLFESHWLPQMRQLYARERRVLALLAAVSVVLAWVFPGAVLQAHMDALWWPLHWILGLGSYGLLGAAAVHAWLLVRTERQLRERPQAALQGLPVLQIERLMFRFVQAGFVLLSATVLVALLSHSVTANWHWDHKTVFSLLAWLVLLALLWGRSRHGWRGKRAAHGVYAASACLLLAYVGSRFVLEVLLHRSAY